MVEQTKELKDILLNVSDWSRLPDNRQVDGTQFEAKKQSSRLQVQQLDEQLIDLEFVKKSIIIINGNMMTWELNDVLGGKKIE